MTCDQKVVAHFRARTTQMCEECLQRAEKELLGYRGFRESNMLPVLFFGDLSLIIKRMGDSKKTAWILGLQTSTVQLALKMHKGRERLPRWLAVAVYRPLWGKYQREWLGILPMRVYLAAHSVLRRRSPKHSWQACRFISGEERWSLPNGRGGSAGTRAKWD